MLKNMLYRFGDKVKTSFLQSMFGFEKIETSRRNRWSHVLAGFLKSRLVRRRSTKMENNQTGDI